MRRLLGEPEIPMPYKHPLIVSELKVFGWKVSGTGKIFAGLGCPNGCDFCCTSHFYKRKHIKLLPDGKDIYAVIERYLDMDPEPRLLDHRRGFPAEQETGDAVPRCRDEERQDAVDFCVLQHQGDQPVHASRKSWKWASTVSGSAMRERARGTPSNRAGRLKKSLQSFASTGSRFWPR